MDIFSQWSILLDHLIPVYRRIYPEDKRDDKRIGKEIMDQLVEMGLIERRRGKYQLPEIGNLNELIRAIQVYWHNMSAQ